MPKPNFLWVDLTVTTKESELSPIFGESFDIRTCVDDRRPEDEMNRIPVAGVCFDFDYPDRYLLSQTDQFSVRVSIFARALMIAAPKMR